MKIEYGDKWLRTVDPDQGETIIVRTEYEPWFLGFARWEVKKLTGLQAGVVAETVSSGRWKWVGREASGCDFLEP